MKPEPVPSAIVSRLVQTAKELEEWADMHRTANLAEHEQGVLEIFRRTMGPALGGVLERALELDQPSARRLRSACPQCGTRRRPHQWRVRSPMSQCGQTPFERPTFWCRPCRRGWSPTDAVLGLAAHQVLSVDLHAWVAETAAAVPFQQAAEQLERLTGIGLGTETVRTRTILGPAAQRRRALRSIVPS